LLAAVEVGQGEAVRGVLRDVQRLRSERVRVMRELT
jgi:hypothetical protein